MVVNTIKAIIKGDGKETIRSNWKKWIVNAFFNVTILLLVSGAFIKYNKLNNAASNADLKKSMEEVRKSQVSFQKQNTLEHDRILHRSKQYTDSKVNALEEKNMIRFSSLENAIKANLANQDLILQNQKTLIDISRRQLEENNGRVKRLEEFHLK